MKNNYNPYNRTYKFICLQNQLAHIKNKNSVKSLGKSNLNINNSPNNSNQILKRSSFNSISDNFSSIKRTNKVKSNGYDYNLIQPYRILHMNEYHDRFKKRKEYYQNQRLAKRLCNISCSIITRQSTEKQFIDHLAYKNIARRYHYSGQPKQALKIDAYTSLTAIKAKKSISLGNDLCNVSHTSSFRGHQKSTKKVTKGLIKQPKSNIIRLY